MRVLIEAGPGQAGKIMAARAKDALLAVGVEHVEIVRRSGPREEGSTTVASSRSGPPLPMFGSPIGPWRLWFAWRPVQSFDGAWMWLRRVDRRRIQKHDYLTGGEPLEQWWQYAPFDDIAAACREQLRQEGRLA
ncbi:hypothetical protein DK419_13260 [Methylobacterium terrae]|uniref:Uncharacterized protein n=1 Tax=Methylobacterium terrae TaxID=2202827 RepID=A0A2U8WLN7_9HYPH|nr:hypothetical protein [Methylobacterium terrae]AWN47165.1 hypothetical protein DK419_13260 [Methylobacterium terrae]